METILWDTPPANLSCSDDEVHIWMTSVSLLKKEIPLFKSLLNHEESSRTTRFVYEKDRDTCILSRVALRDILGRYLAINPRAIAFNNNEYGKPFIDRKDNADNITFNLSHAGDVIICGITSNRDIGIDVELIKEMESIDALIRQNFSGIEQEYFKRLSPDEKKRAFFTCWTRKEAYIKAHGKGLSYPLDSFSVTVGPGDDASLLCDDNDDVSSWSLKEIISSPEYVGAVAVKGRNINYRYYRWDSLRRA